MNNNNNQHEGCGVVGDVNVNRPHCHTCPSTSAVPVNQECLCKGIHSQANASPQPTPPFSKAKGEEYYQGKIDETRSHIAALNTTLGNLSASVKTLFKTQQDTNISMKNQLDQIEAIINLINLNIDTSDKTSTRMVKAMEC